MRFVFNEDQILRLKKRLEKENLNEDLLDDLISKGGSYLEKGVKAAQDFISGLGSDVDVVKKSQDITTKADYIGDNVEDFYKILGDIKEPVSQQEYGSMTHQQSVEAVQIALQILGYKLPRFGTDGLFGPETAEAVRKYKEDKSIVEKIEESFIKIGDQNYSHVKVDYDTRHDEVNDALLVDLQSAAEAAGVVITITTASSGHSKYTKGGKLSRHGFRTAVDIALLNGVGYGNKKFKEYGDRVKDALVSMGYTWNTESGNPKAVLWQTNTGGNHYNHLHVSNKEGVSGAPSITSGSGSNGGETITTEMVDRLVDDLKAKGITSEDIKQYIDPAVITGGSLDFTDLDLTTPEGVEAYKDICDNYIRQRNPNALVTGAMMAEAAKRAYQRYRKYIPPELALSQLTLEGGISTDTTNRPIRTKNPFNVGNTPTKSNPRPTFEDGVNIYYDLIARRYMVNGKTANDLINDFKNDQGNSYADVGYERKLRTLVSDIRRKSEPVYASIKSKGQAITESLLLESDKRPLIKNVLGFNDDWADQFHGIYDKLSVWIADSFLNELIKSGDYNIPQGENPKRFVAQILSQNTPDSTSIWASNYRNKYNYIVHWFRAPRREPINIRELDFNEAYAQAEEWHETLDAKKQSNYKEEGDVFIDYRNADGVGYYWVHLNKSYCSDEADRMGHCARSNSGKLISFRKINEFGEGESFLTVDYRPGGVIGDFHRHGNNKPTARFHKQIVDFLINQTYPVTQLTRSGVHRYEANFQLSDLSPQNLKRVLAGNHNLRYDINNQSAWPEIINAILAGELSLANYGAEVIIRLIKKSEELGKFDEFKEKVTDDIIQDITGVFDNIQTSDKKYFLSKFANEVVRMLTSVLDSGEEMTTEDFITSLRSISKNYFDFYETFCPFIDRGFKRFNEEERTFITSQRGIKRTLYACTDALPFVTRFADNGPVDRNGNIAVKTEENLWGLIKQDGETILHPQFLGISNNPMDRSGKTYIIKNVRNELFKYNVENGEYAKMSMKS
jgi:peptidoglycan hydrolase-like protein with peptidoglycan-binding domain